jgi:hypothetical protein
MKVTDPDDPLLVIAATLLWRWEHDKGKGKRTKMRLSPRNRQRWYAVKDLVEESWTVESTTEVTQIARRILDILELPEDVEIPDWLEEVLEVQVVPHEYRGHYSYRQEQRTPDTPNLACIQVGYRVPSLAWGIVVDRSGSINSMLEPLQQGLMAVHLALEELALPHRIAAFEGNVSLKDFGGTAPMPGAHIARLQGITCSRVTPTLEPTFEALMARPEEVKVAASARWAGPLSCGTGMVGPGSAVHPRLFLLGHLPGKQPPGRCCHERVAIIPTDRLYAIPPNFKGKGWI